jgi:hypothetical protein
MAALIFVTFAANTAVTSFGDYWPSRAIDWHHCVIQNNRLQLPQMIRLS